MGAVHETLGFGQQVSGVQGCLARSREGEEEGDGPGRGGGR